MTVRIIEGDCREVIPTLGAESIDACVCDPPYGLEFMGKDWDAPWQVSSKSALFGKRKTEMPGFGVTRNPTCRVCGGRLRGAGRCECETPTWDEAPNATRQRQMSAFQDWCQEWAEVVYRVLKPGAHLIAFGGTRTFHRLACAIEDAGFEIRDQIGWAFGSGFPKSHNAGNGWGTALKPAWEPIVLARKPLVGTVAANVLQHGTGALNIDASRIGTEERVNMPGSTNPRVAMGGGWREDAEPRTAIGRWPANLIHDGSEEVLAAFPDAGGQQRAVGPANGAKPSINCYGDFGPREQFEPRLDSGSAARFFYSAKADADDRLGSKHPTVKPVDLMAYLCRLVTPPGGTVLDPFAGSGTTGMACMREGFDCILIEREAAYVADIRRRLDHVHGTDTPLFQVGA